ncbi:MAG TPA: nucleotidyltransferase family protein [Pyrinomonadaceae bacterium]|nr:nucleotidyltransferase family protein [Pyrinomonadaceae bacterium]
MPADTEDPELKRIIASRGEHELLLLCARTSVGDEAAGRIRTLARGSLDWDYLNGLARRHAVLPLLHRRLGAHACDAVPLAVRQDLGEKFRSNAARNLLLAGELVRVKSMLEAEDIPVLAYKGPALAVSAYGDLSLRRFVDLDIIVRRRDVLRAKELLQSLGFRAPGGLSSSQVDALLRSQHNLSLAREGDKLCVELHWEVASRRFAAVPLGESVWARAVPVKVCCEEVKVLSPEDLLVALCVHGTKHFWERLAWVCDVAELLNSHPNLDWTHTLGLARNSHVERMLLLGLSLASELVDASLPEGVRRLARADAGVARLSREVAARMFDGAEFEPLGLVRGVSFNLRARRRLLEKVRYLRFTLTPTDGDLLALRLPASLGFAYYLLRPFRILRKRRAVH